MIQPLQFQACKIRGDIIFRFMLWPYNYGPCDIPGKIVRSPYGVVHGKSSPVYYDEKGEEGLLSGLSKYVPNVVFCNFFFQVYWF